MLDGKEKAEPNTVQDYETCLIMIIEQILEFVNLIPGGFVGKECYVETEGTNKVLEFYPEDSNKLQNFYLKERINVKKIRIAFNSSTDFYGRITIYKLDVYA